MRSSEEVMGKFGMVFVSFVVLLSCCVSLSECKRSACWRYGHSCWGGHGKRSGVGVSGESSLLMNSKVGGGIGLGSGTGSSSGENVILGMLDRTTGRFVPFPLLSMLIRNRDSFVHHPPVGTESVRGVNIPTISQLLGQRSIGPMKIKRSDKNLLSAGSALNERNDKLVRHRVTFEDEDNASGSVDQSISKDENSNRSDKTGEYESTDDLTSDVSLSSSGERHLGQANAIFVRDRKEDSVGDSQSNERVNSANEENSQEGSTLPKPHAQFFLNTILHRGTTM